MTENEVIKELNFIKEAYENIAQNGADRYRAIGKGIDCSVEIKTNEDLYSCYVEALNIAIQALEEVQKYRAIGTVDQCNKAMEKTQPQNPIRVDKCTCPSCGTYNETVKKRRNTVNRDIVHCWHCGQAMVVVRDSAEFIQEECDCRYHISCAADANCADDCNMPCPYVKVSDK